MSCSVAGCSRRPHARGWCTYHYAKWRAHGDPMAALPRQRRSALQRFRHRVERARPNECWLWGGALQTSGYAKMRLSTTEFEYVHRFAYLVLVGPIPQGFEIDHLCGTRHCCNPRHLDVVTPQENLRRRNERHGWAAA